MQHATAEKPNIRQLILCAVFTVFIAVGAFIKIPIPYVPITFQLFFVLLAGFLLGAKYAAFSVLLYLVIGLAGVPIFTEGGGFMYVLKPTFGYMLGFIFVALTSGSLSRKIKCMTVGRLFLIGLFSYVPMYVIGTVYFYLIINYVMEMPMNGWAVLWSCVIVFLPADALRSLLAAWVAKRVQPVWMKSA